jgi:hypothetical protein
MIENHRKEVRTMKYEKPEIVVTETALLAVQGSAKMGPDFDTQPSDAAYRSDE